MAKFDLYQTVTDSIVEAIESGADKESWTMPWSGFNEGIPHNAVTGNGYRGVNILMLWAAATSNEFPTSLWASYKQWQSKGAQVKQGSKSTIIVYYGSAKTTKTNDFGEDVESSFKFLKYSRVFNAAQVADYDPPVIERPNLAKRISEAEIFVAKTKAVVKRGQSRAFYTPKEDWVGMPDLNQFTDTKTASATENHYGTLLHELTHWTGNEKRCDRTFGKRFGDNSYAMEELVAELGSAFLCSTIGITPEPRRDHAQYIASWLKTMKADKKAIFTAASKASQATDYLSGLQSS